MGIAVDNCSLVVPRGKDGLNSHQELLKGVLGEVATGAVLIELLVVADDTVQGFPGDLIVKLGALPALIPLKDALKLPVGDAPDNITKHLDEAPVAIKGKASVLRLPFQGLYRLIVETQVQDGVHHAGHRDNSPRPHRDQQWIAAAAKPFSCLLLHKGQGLPDTIPQSPGKTLACFIIEIAGFRGNSEPRGYR